MSEVSAINHFDDLRRLSLVKRDGLDAHAGDRAGQSLYFVFPAARRALRIGERFAGNLNRTCEACSEVPRRRAFSPDRDDPSSRAGRSPSLARHPSLQLPRFGSGALEFPAVGSQEFHLLSPGIRSPARIFEPMPNPCGIAATVNDRSDTNNFVFHALVNCKRETTRDSAMGAMDDSMNTCVEQ